MMTHLWQAKTEYPQEHFQNVWETVHFSAPDVEKAKEIAVKMLGSELIGKWSDSERYNLYTAPRREVRAKSGNVTIWLQKFFAPAPLTSTYCPQVFLWAYVEGQLLTLADRYYTKLKQHHAAYGVSDQTAHLKWLVGAKLSEALRTELLEAGRIEGLMDKNPDLYDAITEAQERDKGWRNVLIDWSGDRDAFNTAILYPVLYPDLLWQEIVK